MKIPKPVAGILLAGFVAIVILIGAIALYTRGILKAVTAPTLTPTPSIPTATPTITPLPTATPLAFAIQGISETLIVIATFHNTAATNSEAHTKIRRAIAAEAADHNEQQLRVEVEPTELTADQRAEAEALGKRYNASMVIWGEDTGVEVIVNFLNLKEPNFAGASTTIIEKAHTQLANPSAYARFITSDLPRTMSFFAFFAVGQSYFLNTQYSVAIERIEAAIALLPSDVKPEGLPDAYFHLGWLYQNTISKNLSQAIDDYDKGIQLNPDYAAAYTYRGIARAAQGNLEEAIADFDIAIQLDPDFAAAYNNRGNAHKVQGNLDEAIADYNKAIQLDPDYAAAYYNRGNVRAAQRKLEEAIADFDQAIELNTNLSNAFWGRGLAYRNLGKPKEALSDFRRYLELQPNVEDRAQVEAWIAKIEEEIAKQR